MKKISIIIPVYNSEKYLNKCIKSVVSQSYSNLQIILINDGSTDRSLQICNKWAQKDSRIEVISQDNNGVSSARNIGLSLVKGDYIGFVDSDDFISVNMYEHLVTAAVAYKADIVETNYARLYENIPKLNKGKLKESITNFPYNCTKNYLLSHNTTNYIWNKLYHSTLFRNLEFPNLKYSEDFYINVITHMRCKTKVTLPYIDYYYVDTEDSATSQAFNTNKLDILKSAEMALKKVSIKFPGLTYLVINYLLTNTRNLYFQANEINASLSNSLYKKYVNLYDSFPEDRKKIKGRQSLLNTFFRYFPKWQYKLLLFRRWII